MRLYYFTSTEHPLSNVESRKVKISEIMKLNDPFEFMAINLQEAELRRAARKMKSDMASKSGVICFSRSWQHPLMWSHYGDRHQGICLGFDVSDEWCCSVDYVNERISVTAGDIIAGSVDASIAMQLVSAKASYWAYEQEVRIFCTIAARDAKGLAFKDFDNSMILREVIVGPNSPASRAQVAAALGELAPSTHCFKSRIAFGYFEVCENQNPRLWD